MGKAGTTSFELATQVLGYDKWTPEILAERQRELLETYRTNWDL